MKEVVTPLAQKGFLFRSLHPFSLAKIGSRMRIGLYVGIDERYYYALIFRVVRTQPIGLRDVQRWHEILKRVEANRGHAMKKVFVLLRAPIRENARQLLQEGRWDLIAD